MKHLLFAGCIVLGLMACNQPQTRTQNAIEAQKMEGKPSSEFTPDMVTNKKDPVCNMLTSGGISDTLHLDGKALGFCSAVCKEDFAKDPAKYKDKLN